MGLSILGFEEEDTRSSTVAVQTQHVVVEKNEGRNYESNQMVMTMEDDLRDASPCRRNASYERPHYPHHRHTVDNSSILGDMAIFRDFFLAAFSDYNVTCCGGEGIFDECNTMPSNKISYCSAKLAQPSDSSSYHHHPTSIRTSSFIGRTTSSLSQNSTPAIQNNASHDSKRRQRPLAVAVGFKYAEDMNGRPIIITPGNRIMPVRGPRSPSSSPSSHSTNYARKEITPNVLFPVEQETKKGPQSTLLYKAS